MNEYYPKTYFCRQMQLRECSYTHNARHSSAEKSEGIIAPMVPHKGRICTSPLRQDRPERSPPCTSPPSRHLVTARTNECSLHFAHPREAHAPQSHHPVLPPRCRFLPPCIPWMRAPLADKQGRGLASPLKSRTLLSGGHGDINCSPLA